MPINWLLAVTCEVLIGPAEGPTAEESTVCREGRWMRRLYDAVLCCVDKGFLRAGKVAPEDENEVLAFIRECLNDSVSKNLPSSTLMRACYATADGKSGVQQQNTLLSQPIL